MRIIYRKIRHARYVYIKRNVEKVWGARYTLVARYLSKNAVVLNTLGFPIVFTDKNLKNAGRANVGTLSPILFTAVY